MIAIEDKPTIPELRFPIFDGDWNKKRLGRCAIKIGSGVTPKGGSAVYLNQGIPLIRSQNVINDRLEYQDIAYISEAVHRGMIGSEVYPKDVLLNITGASIGRSCVVPKTLPTANVNQHVCIIRLTTGYLPEFLQAYLSSWRGQKQIYQAQAGGGREGLNFQNIGSFHIHFPEKSEQIKIASFLGAVDEKLEKLRRKRELLTDYKRGMMQQIFSQQIRFKSDDGSEFPEWEEKKFGDVYEWINTNSLSREMLSYEEGSIQNIHYGDIHKKFKSQFYQENEIIPYIRPEAISNDFDETAFCTVGDLVIADASEDYADIGKAVEIISVKPQSLLAGLHTFIARPNKTDVVAGFSGYMFKSENMRKQIMRIAQGISVLGISKPNISKLFINLPHPNEQRKIADFFFAIDRKISAVSDQYTHMEAFKKGLLQKMFV